MKHVFTFALVMAVGSSALAEQPTASAPARNQAKTVAPAAQAKTQPAAAAPAKQQPATQEQSSQVVVVPTPNINTLKYVLATERRRIFEQAMGLAESEKDAFWTTYTQYEKERAQVDEAALKLVASYAKDFTTLTDAQALKLVRDTAAAQQRGIALRSKYTVQFSKNLSGKVAARFFQVSDYVDTAVRLDALDNIPLIGSVAQPTSSSSPAGSQQPAARTQQPAPQR